MFADVSFLGFTLSVFWFTFVAFLWILAAILPAMIAKNKGHNFFGWFVLSLFFWWITLFVAILMKDKHDTATPAQSY
jgi:hypothetical protein